MLNSSGKREKETANNEVGSSAPTSSEIVKWTFRQESIAPCFVKDIFALEEDPQGGFYWIGRMPCRTARIVGLIVGIVQHDDNARYSVDDGSGIIDCLQKHDKPPPTPKKHGKNAKSMSIRSAESRPPPPPIADIGRTIRVEGKISRARGSKVLRVERRGITVCKSANDEPLHWAEVIRLHKDVYSREEPFIIPIPKEPSTPPRPPRSQLLSSPQSNLASSPVKDLSSPVKPSSDGFATQPSSPPRLRYPSKLKTRDLTGATFRIYVKHYIDNAPELQYIPPQSIPESSGAGSSRERMQRSFTVGYLRRVPLLADMAKSVVKAERKRREREARKPQELQNQRPSHPGPSKSSHALNSSSETTSRKMKRLFIQTIRNLYAEGSIVIWDGPKCVHNSQESSQHSFMWKNHSATISSISQNTMITSVSQGYDSSGELSDEDPNEEAYIPASLPYVAEVVLDSMRKLSARSRDSKEGLAGTGIRSRNNFQPPTASDIVSYLHRTDERWAKLGEWAIKEALEYLESEDYVFKAGKGRWALCL